MTSDEYDDAITMAAVEALERRFEEAAQALKDLKRALTVWRATIGTRREGARTASKMIH